MWNDFFEQELAALKDRGLMRELHALPQTGGEISLDGRQVLNFSSNDYLALARDKRLQDAAITVTERFGCGATASRLLAGHLELHEALESALADMMGTEATLVFGSGFLTNLGVLSTLAGTGDTVFSDWLNHASLIDGIRLGHAHCYRYRHKDMNHLEELLRKHGQTGKRIIVSESVFSMDGDVAPLKSLADLARQYDALLVVDEAHAIGVMGTNGGGACRIVDREIHPDIVVGTLSKSLGGYGGYVACSSLIRKYLVNKARTFLFSTGLPPACVGSALEAVSIVTMHPEMGETLLHKAETFHKLLSERGLKTLPFETQIVPVIVGDNVKVLQFSRLLWEKGLLINAIRPPTVPVGTSRVRLSVSLSMTDKALLKAAGTIAECARETGII